MKLSDFLFYEEPGVTLYCGDSFEILPLLYAESCTSVCLESCDGRCQQADAIVTDPPYGLEFMGKEWDRFAGRAVGATEHADHMNRSKSHGPWGRRDRPINPNSYGHRNEKCRKCGRWRVSSNRCQCPVPEYETRLALAAPAAMLAYQEWSWLWACEALRILKPGAHLLAFGGTRTHHRLMCALEDAGFEIRDSVAYFYAPRTEGVMEAWRLWSLDNAGIRFRELAGDSVPAPVLLDTSLENSPAHALIAELCSSEARLTNAASWRSALSGAGGPTTESSALVNIAGLLPESLARTSGGGSTALSDAQDWLDASRAARIRAVEALRIWLGSGPSLKRAATDALCAALTDALKAITCAQSKTFQSYDTIRRMVCVSATTVTTTVSMAASLLAFTVGTLETEEGGDAPEASAGPLAWIYGSGFP